MENGHRLSRDRYREKMMGCWLGKAVGGTLGMPYEGYVGPLDLDFYDPFPESMVANDDLDLQVLWACLLNMEEKPLVRPELFECGWQRHIRFPWDEYGGSVISGFLGMSMGFVSGIWRWVCGHR